MALRRSRDLPGLRGSIRSPARWTGSWCIPSCWRATRSAIPRERPLYVYRPPGVRRRGDAGAVGLRDPGVHRPGRHVARALARSSRRRRAAGRDVRRRRLPGGDRRVRRRVDLARRLAVPQLVRHRPLPGLPVRRGRAVRRRALPDARRPRPPRARPASPRAVTARWSCRCCAPTCSARSPRTPATRCSSAATCRTSRRSRASCATRSTARARSFTSGSRQAELRLRRFGKPLEIYGYACAYSPDPERPGEALLPFEIATGRLLEDVWARWLELTRCGWRRHADALRSMRRIYLDAGRSDEWYLDLGAQAFAAELTRLGVEHTLELFDGRHGGIAYRYPGAIRELVRRCADGRRPIRRAGLRRAGARWPSWSGRRGHAARARRAVPAPDRGARPAAQRVPRDARRAGAGRGRRAERDRRRRCAGVPIAVKDDLAVAGQVDDARLARADAAGEPPTPRRCAGCARPARSRSGSPTCPS